MEKRKIVGLSVMLFSLALLAFLWLLKADFDNLSAFLCQAFHENHLDMTTCPAHKSNASWLFSVAFMASVSTFGLGGAVAFAPSSKGVPIPPNALARQPTRAESIEAPSDLRDEERKVFDFLKEKNGSAYQSDLVKGLGFSKVRVTRVLDGLESRDLLERKRRGMTNLVVLK